MFKMTKKARIQVILEIDDFDDAATEENMRKDFKEEIEAYNFCRGTDSSRLIYVSRKGKIK